MRAHVWVGAAVWGAVAGLAVTGRFWLLEPAFLLAPLVLVPLALDRVTRKAPPRVLKWAHPLAAAAATASFFCARGPTAAGLAAGWLAFTLLLALFGLRRAAAGGAAGWRDTAERSIDAGLLLVPVGGGWLVLSRLGATPLGFEEPIVLLTAVHFHYTAFVTLVLLGLAGRALGSDAAHRGVALGTAAGTPLVAAGITLDPALELAGVALVSVSLWGFAAWLLRRLKGLPAGTGRTLLAVSALSLLPSMAAALAWSAGQDLGQPLVALSWMARLHGPLNALGFGLAGLLGWTLLGAQPPAPVPVDTVRRTR
jgi:hypothetical protein